MHRKSRSSSQTTPPSLLDRIRDHGDANAWTAFCDVYSPMLYDFCRKRGLQASDAADVVQETLLRVAKGILKFEYDPSRGRFRDWLYTIVRNEIRRMVSKRKPTVESNPNDHDESDSQTNQEWNEHFYDHILKSALERIQPKFEPDTWEAFIQVWLNLQPANVVAKKLKRTLNFVYLSKSRVIKRLRLEVEQLADEAGLNHANLS